MDSPIALNPYPLTKRWVAKAVPWWLTVLSSVGVILSLIAVYFILEIGITCRACGVSDSIGGVAIGTIQCSGFFCLSLYIYFSRCGGFVEPQGQTLTMKKGIFPERRILVTDIKLARFGGGMKGPVWLGIVAGYFETKIDAISYSIVELDEIKRTIDQTCRPMACRSSSAHNGAARLNLGRLRVD